MADGEVGLASRYLVAAGEVAVRASDVGQPGMLLVKELLARGERTAPLAYLRLCAQIWHTADQRIDQWIYTVEQGGFPDFGVYLMR